MSARIRSQIKIVFYLSMKSPKGIDLKNRGKNSRDTVPLSPTVTYT